MQTSGGRKTQSIKLLNILPCPPGKLGGQDSFESIESFESCERLTQSWSSQSSFSSLQRVPSYDSFDSEDYPTALHGHKPKGTFKDYVRERSDLSKDKPVIPAAALAGYTGTSFRIYFLIIILKKQDLCVFVWMYKGVRTVLNLVTLSFFSHFGRLSLNIPFLGGGKKKEKVLKALQSGWINKCIHEGFAKEL